MQRVYGEYDIMGTSTDDIVQKIKEYELNLGLNAVPERFFLRKLGVRVDAACEVEVNGRAFSVIPDEPLEFGYESIKVEKLIFKTPGVNAIVRYMYFKEDKTYQ